MGINSVQKDHVGVGVAILDTGVPVVSVFENRNGQDIVIQLARTRKQVDMVIAALERCKLHLPEEPSAPLQQIDNADDIELAGSRNDATNLPPMSNKVEGGGHFGLG